MEKNKKKTKKKMIVQLIALTVEILLISFICLLSLLTISMNVNKWEIKGPSVPHGGREQMSPNLFIIIAILASLVIGVVLAIYLSNRFLRPISKMKDATEEVAKGNFDCKMENIPDNELGEFMNNFNSMVDELKKNEMLKNDFISNVSHEFKTPLSNIQGYVTLLQDDTLSKEEKDKYYKTIIESTNNLANLVNNILKISKLDNDKVILQKEEYSLDEQLRESILSFESKWTLKNIDFDLSLKETKINADKNLLSNVWNNLIGNAIKFSNDKGKISIKIDQDIENIIVSIKDNGCGMDEKELPYIFDKFYQVDKSHYMEGNGLGLSLVNKIVNLHNGKIEVHSKLNKGTEFIIYLPINN